LFLRLRERDQDTAGSVIGSAIAFRLFLFFVPFLLCFIGVAGFVSGIVSARDVTETVGISGGLATQIRTAFAQPGATHWLATALGLVGMATAGRSLSKVLWAASTAAWGLPRASKASLRVVASIVGLVSGMGLLAVLVNLVRADLGVAAAGASFVVVLAVYFVAWMVVSLLLPRATSDPGAVLPGALLVALTITLMHAVAELYVPAHLSRASELYGGVGATIVTLGWFFILGRSIIIAMTLNAVLYERFGSMSTLVFSVPGVRMLPRHSARLRRLFDLDTDSDSSK
jgi:uncharacterized BrkB/YihY/UPF0761 family membrane protein